jgi:hypothetical protein
MPNGRSFRLVWAATLGLFARPANAQRVSTTLELGGSSLRYADTLATTAATIGPSVGIDWARASLGFTGSFSQLGSDGWSTQGTLASSLFTPSLGALLGEVAGSAGGSAHEDGSRTGQTLLSARAHLMESTRGAWLGAGVGKTWDGTVWRGVRSLEAAGWFQASNTMLLASFEPTVVDDTIRYRDATVAVRWTGTQLELGGTAGARSGQRVPALGGTAKAWGSVNMTAWVMPRIGVVLSGGTYPVDLTQGFPGGRFLSLGVRFASRSMRRESREPQETPITREIERSAKSGITELTVDRTTTGRRLRIRAPSAQSVEVRADFTGWTPMRLTRAADGWWTLTSPVAPGTYQLNVRVDNGSWVVPPGLTATLDEFGGATGLLVVQR